MMRRAAFYQRESSVTFDWQSQLWLSRGDCYAAMEIGNNLATDREETATLLNSWDVSEILSTTIQLLGHHY